MCRSQISIIIVPFAELDQKLLLIIMTVEKPGKLGEFFLLLWPHCTHHLGHLTPGIYYINNFWSSSIIIILLIITIIIW